MAELDNPYWWWIQRAILTGAATLDEATKTLRPVPGASSALNFTRRRYSPTISDPDVVEYLAKVATQTVVEVDAGNGYWSYLLNQIGKRVTAYDLHPMQNGWYPILKLDPQRLILREHPDATLVCMSDSFPYNSTTLSMRKFSGARVVMSCEKPPTETNALKEFLEREWVLESTMDAGVRKWDELRTIYEYRRKTFWNQATRLNLPFYTPGGE